MRKVSITHEVKSSFSSSVRVYFVFYERTPVMNVKQILFPTDFSASSDAAWNYASSLAAESGARLHILHVGNESTAYLAGYSGFGAGPDLAEQIARENRARLDQVKPTVARVEFQLQYLSGTAEHEILTYAKREHIDLIVIGSHGRTGLSRLLLGSVAEAVVRSAECPVLTVKHPIAEAAESEEGQQQQSQHPEPIAKHSLH
jgi:nucleotide-binding universal stress UspA family protein